MPFSFDTCTLHLSNMVLTFTSDWFWTGTDLFWSNTSGIYMLLARPQSLVFQCIRISLRKQTANCLKRTFFINFSQNAIVYFRREEKNVIFTKTTKSFEVLFECSQIDLLVTRYFCVEGFFVLNRCVPLCRQKQRSMFVACLLRGFTNAFFYLRTNAFEILNWIS